MSQASMTERELYTCLVNEVGGLDRTWTLFEAIFFNQRYGSFHGLMPHSCNVIYRTIQRDVALMITRLMDPADSRVRNHTRPNVTIPALMKKAGIDAKSDACDRRLADVYRRCETASSGFRNGRNREIAHLDAVTYTQDQGQRVAPRLDETADVIREYKRLLEAVARERGWPQPPWEYFSADEIRREIESILDRHAQLSISGEPRGTL